MSSRYGRFLATKHDRWEARTKPRLEAFRKPGEAIDAVALGVGRSFPWILIPVAVVAVPLLRVRPVIMGVGLFFVLIVIGSAIAAASQRIIVATDRRLLTVRINILGRPRKLDRDAPLDVVHLTVGKPGIYGPELTVETPSGVDRFLVLKGAQPGLPRLLAAVDQHIPPRPI